MLRLYRLNNSYIIGCAMTAAHSLFEVAGGIATITLNRPDKLNAWTRQMENEVRQAMQQADGDSNVRVIVLTGAGRGFCAGADMSILEGITAQGVSDQEIAQAAGSSAEAFNNQAPADFQKRYSYFAAITKPVICAINGPAVGLGLVIALFCDLRFASDAARFSTAFSRRGLIAEYGLAWMLPKLVGHANALDLLFSARLIDAPEALRMGLVNQVFPHAEFASNVLAYAADLASNVSPRSMRVMKRQVYDALLQSLSESVNRADVEMVGSLRSEDFKEGVAHFLEKRAPKFTGR